MACGILYTGMNPSFVVSFFQLAYDAAECLNPQLPDCNSPTLNQTMTEVLMIG